ncbi:MAG: hypothetical protein M9947_06440 [Thermomicrobiales bacterium]|nr:hypothetical protein [Thermomicrobiales bacterium]
MRNDRQPRAASGELGTRLPEWQDEWTPQPWKPPAEADEYDQSGNRRPRVSRAAIRAAQQPRLDRRREQLLLSVSPAVTGLVALLLWFLSPLPGAGSMPLGFVILAAVQVVGYLVTRDDRPDALAKPWTIHLAAAIGLLPMLSIQVALIREPYVSIESGSALAAVLATMLVIFLTVVLALVSAMRFWTRPDQASLVFLPVALLIPQAVGERSQIGVGQALGILAMAMLLGAIATIVSSYVGTGIRLLIPPVVLGVQIMILWMAGRGPVFHPTSGGIVRLLYILMLTTAVVLVVSVPIIAVWLRRWAPPSAGGALARGERSG